MRILITNDDGINAPGIYVLEKIAATLSDDIWIVAPAEEQSGTGHSLTLTRPVRLRRHAERRFSVTGTPTDAVTMALKKVMPERPDLILSGVNRGANLGDDITYSGTVSAAFEGALAGIRSIALSQVYSKEGIGNEVSFAAAEAWGEKVLRPLIERPFAERTLVNVNFPPVAPDKVQGIRVVRQGFHDYARGSIVEGTDPRGFDYYWFGLHGIEQTPGHETDLEAIADGFVSVTPLTLDFTHRESLPGLTDCYRQ
ncbi:5'-nucleotidase SurE [Novosphingobium marinum]|uniref:5'-nucleotidase SurE n=1 Tax=Novosphingobium marinum TaxID=1514948 RepID=A0A7Y9XXD6_9SPHN|nr:5'/3'-nucleotidase SurE [Novosphingobium marinum]NYH96359.1 5'-nucleotidase [Novosphingobium marinum]GGC34632.1 5'-nucleotidase SurE [Novosphingobium marinum]